MGAIFNFLNKNSNFFLFVFLICLSLYFTIKQNVFHNTAINSNFLCFKNNIDNNVSEIKSFFSLKDENKKLNEENSKLKKKLFNYNPKLLDSSRTFIDTIQFNESYELFPAEIINATITHQKNYLTIKGGSNQGIKEGMGVLGQKGIVGQIAKVDKNYSLAISLLNPFTKIKSRIKDKEFHGILIWKGEDIRLMHLIRIPKFVEVEKGDTIETDGKSSAYPEGISLGKVIDVKLQKSTNDLDITVQIFEDLATLKHVQIVKNLKLEEIKKIESNIENLNAE